MRKAVIHTDGASSGNPGPAGIGVLVECGGKRLEISEHIGAATNNVAEYKAFIRGLEEALKLGAEEAAVRMDSELIVKQMKGTYKVRSKGLIPLHLRARSLMRSFKRLTIEHIPRGKNSEADRLSKEAVAIRRDPAKRKQEQAGPNGKEAAKSQEELF